MVLVGSTLAWIAPSAGAADSDTLSSAAGRIRWTAGPLDGTVARPEACALGGCDERRITVALPRGAWAKPGGVQVGIRWRHDHDDLDLYVYGPDGSLAASSAGFASSAESVLLEGARNGTYRVVVVPSGAEAVRYEGLAEVEYRVPPRPAKELRPDLVPLKARRLSLGTSAYLFDLPVPSTPSGCYPEETIEQGARRCLRFDQTISNVGAGPFELRYRLDGVATTKALTQRIYRSDGTYRDRFADTYEFHPTHAHFHYKNFARSHLWRSDASGTRIGSEPIRSGRKNGFCLVDVDNVSFGHRGDAARHYVPPTCLAPTEVDPLTGETSMLSGISPGWADVYWWYLADQFIEISGVPDGDYLIQTVADPAGTVVESDDNNNQSWTHVRLRNGSAQIV